MAPKKKAAAKALVKEEEAAAAAPAVKKEEPTVMKAAAKIMPAPKAAPEAEKRKADEKADEPVKKEAKMEPKAKAAVKKEAESKPEMEVDAPADKRAAVKDVVGFRPSDTTLNVISTMGGKVLMSLTEGGMQYLIAGARANLGMKAGRYMFEVKIVETLNPAEASAGARNRVPAPRQLLRIGFSAAASPLILGDSAEHVFFDSEGAFWSGKKRTAGAQKFQRDQVIGVLLNLDPNSPNANTLSIFRDGQRISEPQPIPESLHGKTLFPHLSFRNVTVQVLFGKEPAHPLPFKCRTIGGAAQGDVVKAANDTPKDGKHEVMLPVAFPDHGTFDWLDTFLTKNPQYVELSDRKIIEWAASSGLLKPKAAGPKHSNDKPEFNYGLPSMDDLSVRRVLSRVAPLVPRNYVVMEVKSNLIETERKEILSRFSSSQFKKTAHVVMGEPTEEFKQMRLDKLLKDKQEKADAAWKAKKAEEKRKKEAAEKQKHLNEMRKKAEEARKKAAAEAKKKLEEAKKKAEAEKKKAEAEKRKAEAKKKAEEAGEEYVEEEEEEEDNEEEQMLVDDEVKEEEEEDEKKDEDMELDGEEEEPPQVELTEEEKKMWMQPTSGSSDLTSVVLSQSFGKFTIPEKAEGFDELRFEWQKEAQSKDYLSKWVRETKRSSRIDDLQPGQWFQDKVKEWKELLTQWQAKQKTWKAEEKKKLDAKKKAGEEDKAEEEDENTADEVNVFEVEDVCDTGNGEPLFKDFAFEDWALLQLRFELHLLQVAFKKDVDDPDRVGVHDTHLPFYYTKYFRKQLNPKNFNVSSNTELAALIKDAVTWDEEEKVLRTPLEEDLANNNIFVQLAEENRRERQRRIEAGDETARLKFTPMAMQQAPAAKATGAPPVAAGQVRPAGAWAGNAWGGGGAWASPGWQRW